MPKDMIVNVLNTQLAEHRKNMRRIYNLDDVRRMGLSQLERARAGQPACMEPLIVTPGAGVDHYDSKVHHKLIVIAGHLRLRGNRWLKAQAPLLNCVLRFYRSESAMLADMSTENGIRADPGPVSWGLHFQSLLAEGVPIRQVARDAGKSVATVKGLMRLLELGPVAQDMIDHGQLPEGCALKLLRIPDARLQDRAARRFAKAKTPLYQMDIVIEHLLNPHLQSRYANKTSFGKQAPKRLVDPDEMRRLADTPAAPALVGMPEDLSAGLIDLRAAAAVTCNACSISREHGQPEPAWHLATAAAGEVCTACNMRLVKDACAACPLPQMLSRVVRQAAKKRPLAKGMITTLVGVNA